jgi:DDE superfamily endonuclease
VSAIPLPPQKTLEEHAQTQAAFLEQKLEPALAEARAGDGHVFFVDAAHFVMGSFLCCVWCLVRLALHKIAALGLQGPITLVLDNARYQHCGLVMGLAKSLDIHLEFLPSYSPNLNLIERLWKFIKKQALYGRHYGTFQEFKAAIDGCLAKISTDHRDKLNTLMTHRFQTLDNVSLLAA